MSPARRRQAFVKAMTAFQISERRACRALGVPRSSQRYVGAEREREEELLSRIRALAREHPRYGDRRNRALLRRKGWSVNLKRVHRLWRREGLEVPQIQGKRRRLGQSEDGCTRRRAERPDHVWSYDFVHDQTAYGRGLKMLPMTDEFARECLSIEVERGLRAEVVVSTLEYLFEVLGEPEFIRGDNGPEFIAEAVRSWWPAAGRSRYTSPRGALGERLQRDVQQPAKGRTAGPRGVRDAEGGEGHPRRPPPGLQPPPPAQLAGVSDPGGVRSGPGQAGVALLPSAGAVPIPDPDSHNPRTRIRGQVTSTFTIGRASRSVPITPGAYLRIQGRSWGDVFSMIPTSG